MYSPIHNNVLIELDPEVRMIGSLHVPDKNSLKYCKKCDKMMEAIDGPCIPVEHYEWDRYHDRPDFKGYDYSHDISYATAPVVLSSSRIGTVLKTGVECCCVSPGDRVMISSTTGGSLDDVRLVPETAILGFVYE